MSRPLLSPRDLADAIGASESSLRRWIDSGRLKMSRTAGGHRRIELAEALRFVRESRLPLVRPEILGIGELAALKQDVGEEQQLFDALVAGDRALARGLVVSWFTAGRSLAWIFDQPMRAALHRLGELWKRTACGILAEHRATDICLELLHHLRALLPATSRNGAPVALGATPGDEWHGLASLMASAVAREAGFRDVNYGANIPINLLAPAAAEQRARLVWLSVTMRPQRGLRAAVAKLATQLARSNTTLILGGQSAEAACPSSHPNIRRLASMSEFASFLAESRSLRARR